MCRCREWTAHPTVVSSRVEGPRHNLDNKVQSPHLPSAEFPRVPLVYVAVLLHSTPAGCLRAHDVIAAAITC